ncbi:MAG: hemerythrin domain-containing protein [Dechloromonas sp.]|nr:hemerythrin domain-containing protein [Dechloromonas sp.]
MADHGLHLMAPVATITQEATGWLADVGLPPELLTGHKVIDGEHRLLLSSISGLRRICVDQAKRPDCGDCDSAARHHCEMQLVAMLGDVLSFILDHFKTEEAIMRDSLLRLVDRELCEAHMEDHAAISGKVQEIVAALDPMNNLGLIRELDLLLSRWVVNHIALHDMQLVRWVEREDSVLRQNKPTGS